MKDMVAIVTGGGSGFGEGICQLYAKEGAKVVVADIHREHGERVADALRKQGYEAHFVFADVGDSKEMNALVKAAIHHFGRVDVMVNNAGISHSNQPMLDVSEEQFDLIFRVNVKSIYLSAMHCVPSSARLGGRDP
jgi:3-oxoacyl-[acyl-carrier protein] reductase